MFSSTFQNSDGSIHGGRQPGRLTAPTMTERETFKRLRCHVIRPTPYWRDCDSILAEAEITIGVSSAVMAKAQQRVQDGVAFQVDQVKGTLCLEETRESDVYRGRIAIPTTIAPVNPDSSSKMPEHQESFEKVSLTCGSRENSPQIA